MSNFEPTTNRTISCVYDGHMFICFYLLDYLLDDKLNDISRYINLNFTHSCVFLKAN